MPRTYHIEESIFWKGKPSQAYNRGQLPVSIPGQQQLSKSLVLGSRSMPIPLIPPYSWGLLTWRGNLPTAGHRHSTHSPCRIGSTLSGEGDSEFPAPLAYSVGLAGIDWGEGPKGAICRASPMARGSGGEGTKAEIHRGWRVSRGRCHRADRGTGWAVKTRYSLGQEIFWHAEASLSFLRDAEGETDAGDNDEKRGAPRLATQGPTTPSFPPRQP